MAIAPRMIPAIQGVPVMRDGQQAGIAPTGYAPGTVVQMLGQQLMQPPAPVAVPVPVPAQIFAPVEDDTGDVGEQETNAANAQPIAANSRRSPFHRGARSCTAPCSLLPRKWATGRRMSSGRAL